MVYINYMPYKTGSWGEQAKERHKRRITYFRERRRRLDDVKNTLGFDGEQEAIKLFNTEKLPINSGADLQIKGNLIDVKTSILRKVHGSLCWMFQISRQKKTSDYFLCIAKDENYKTMHILLIPNKDTGNKKNICIAKSRIGKYKRYFLKVR